MVETLQSIAAGRAVMREQHSSEATYAPKIARADARIRWTETAEVIARRVRAYDPWPGAETFCAASN